MVRNRTKHITNNKAGSALLVVLFIVMVITILSLGFLSRSDVELSCGQNMILHGQMDCLAQSGLKHAEGLIRNPQSLSSEYWTGAIRQQLVTGSSDYYDVTVTKLGECNYQITSKAYREKSGQTVGQSRLKAEMRLDPCIAYWQNFYSPIPQGVAITGDIYSQADLWILGSVYGDVYSRGSIVGSAGGKAIQYVSSCPIDTPVMSVADFAGQYFIGSTAYTVTSISSAEMQNVTVGAVAGNPSGIYYRNGDLTLKGTIRITGTLVVKNDLLLASNANVIITATKNFPALIVGHDLRTEDNYVRLSTTGYTQIGNHIDMKSKIGAYIDVLGSLYVFGDGIKNVAANFSGLTVTGSPSKSATQIWPVAGTARRWSPAGSSFFKTIQRY